MKELNILIPGLLWKNITDINYIYQDLALPNLTKLIKHARYTVLKQHSLSQILYSLKTKSNTQSVAQLLATQLGVKTQYNTFVLCEPTHLRLDRDRLLISEAELLQLNEEESKQYIELINNHFENELKLYYIHDELWLLGHNYPSDDYKRPPIIDIIGENIDDYMNSDNRYCHKLNAIINEIQMLLYNCEYNRLRQEEGSFSLNSIWLSDIDLSKLTLPQFDTIYSNNLNKLFNNANSFTVDTLENITDNELLIIDDLYYPNCYLDSFGYTDRLKALDDTIFAKLNHTKSKLIKLIVPQTLETIIIKIPKTNILNCWHNTNIIKLTKDTHEA